MISNKQIFITGGAGFIANLLIKHYVGKNQIIVYDNFVRDTLTNSGLADHPNLHIIRGDILDYCHLYESMAGSDIVIHAAAIAGIESVLRDPVHTMTVNMIGTANTLKAAYVTSVKDRFIDFSTSEVFGSHAFKCKENTQAVSQTDGHARWTYAVSKLAAETLAHAYYTRYNMPVVTVRPFNVYGPGQTGEGAMHDFIKHALLDEPITIYGDGNQIRAWCYVDDFVNCLTRCIEDPKAIGHKFNIGNQRAVITILGLAQTICRTLKSSSEIIFAPPLTADIELRVPDTAKSLDVLGFKATVDLEEGILKTAQWLKGTLNVKHT